MKKRIADTLRRAADRIDPPTVLQWRYPEGEDRFLTETLVWEGPVVTITDNNGDYWENTC